MWREIMQRKKRVYVGLRIASPLRPHTHWNSDVSFQQRSIQGWKYVMKLRQTPDFGPILLHDTSELVEY